MITSLILLSVATTVNGKETHDQTPRATAPNALTRRPIFLTTNHIIDARVISVSARWFESYAVQRVQRDPYFSVSLARQQQRHHQARERKDRRVP